MLAKLAQENTHEENPISHLDDHLLSDSNKSLWHLQLDQERLLKALFCLVLGIRLVLFL